MPSFAYSAINAQGVELSGEIQATDLSAARDALRGNGLMAQRLEEITAAVAQSGGSFLGIKKKAVKSKSLQIFSRQFATMIEAGLSVVTALVILEQQTDDTALAVVIDDVRERVEGGALLSEALAAHPDVFSRLYVAMVEAGEAAGVLDVVLDRVAMQIEKDEKIKRRVKSAMIYPSVVLTFAFLVLTGLLMFLVPVFVKIFGQLGGQLPKLTQIILHMSNGLRYPWFPGIPIPGVIFVLGGLGGGVFFFRRWKRTDSGRASWDSLSVRFQRLKKKTPPPRPPSTKMTPGIGMPGNQG